MVVRPQWTPSPSDPMTQPFSSVSEASRPWPSSAAIAHGATQGIPWRLSEWRSDRPIRDSLDASPGGGGRDGLTGVGFFGCSWPKGLECYKYTSDPEPSADALEMLLFLSQWSRFLQMLPKRFFFSSSIRSGMQTSLDLWD